jgi:hypothetical protein
MNGTLWVDEFITHTRNLGGINEGFDDMHVSLLLVINSSAYEADVLFDVDRVATAFDVSSTCRSCRHKKIVNSVQPADKYHISK